MKKQLMTGVVASSLVLSGCASITGDTVQAMRVETRLADGTEVRDADCELFNEYGSYKLKTPGSVMVRRSSTDLNISCKKDGQTDARATSVSRANAGMWGNIIFGGGIGAVIDHNKGTAYTYPQWIQLIFGKLLAFDRSDDKDGQPSLAREVGNATAAPILPAEQSTDNKPATALTPASKSL